MKFYDKPIRVPVNRIHPNEYNPFAMNEKVFAKEVKSIKEDGFIGAIEVRKDPEKIGEYIIVDGEQRFRAAKEAGYTEIPVLVTEKDDVAQAKITTIKRNALKGDPDTIKMAHLLTSLTEEHGISVEDLTDQLGWEKEMIEGISGVIDAPPEEDLAAQADEALNQVETKNVRIVLTFNENEFEHFLKAMRSDDWDDEMTNENKIIELCKEYNEG